MNEIRIYEPKREPCKICKERLAVVLPVCEDEGKRFWYPVCLECRDKVPYKNIPVNTEMDEGYFFCPNCPSDGVPQALDPKNFDSKLPVMTRYGKKLLIKDNLL